jgi:hypothetical protein
LLQKRECSGIPFLFCPVKAFLYFIICALLAAYVLWVAWLTQTAAHTIDTEFRPLGAANYDRPSGPVYMENDSYYWLGMAEQMREDDVWRVRWTMADNAPWGRPVYWSQSIAWLINGVAALPPFRTAEFPLAAASFWVNPFIQVAVICGLAILLSPLGWRVTVMVLALFVALGDVSWAFSSLRPDHQSLQAAFAVLMVAALFREGFGFGRPQLLSEGASGAAPRHTSRWLFVFAGLCAGLGLWVSSAVFMPLLIILTVAVCAVALLSQPQKWSPSPKSWMVWGSVAGLTSLVFWFLEFFPAVNQTRLEVNNPAFSLWAFLLGCGMTLAAGLSAKEGNGKIRSFAFLVAVTLLCLLLPALILFGPTTWYWPRDISMDRLHNFIMEFYTFSNFTKGKAISTLWGLYYLTLPLGFLLILPAVRWRDTSSRAALWILFLLLCALFAMSMRQIRWLALFAPVLALAAGVSTARLSAAAMKVKTSGRWLSTAIVAVFLVQAGFLAAQQVKALQAVIAGRSLLNELVPAVLNKHFAASLASLQEKPTAVMADPNLAPALYYFARIPSVASFYWENRDGVRDAGIFFADTGDLQEAAKIAQQRGLTHIIVPSGPLFPNYFDFVKHGHYDMARAKTTLASKLTEGSALSLPDWIEVDEDLDRLGKAPFIYKREPIEQYLNVYRVILPSDDSKKADPRRTDL